METDKDKKSDNNVIVVADKTINAEILLRKLYDFTEVEIQYLNKHSSQAERLAKLIKRLGIEERDRGTFTKELIDRTKIPNERYDIRINFIKLKRTGFVERWPSEPL